MVGWVTRVRLRCNVKSVSLDLAIGVKTHLVGALGGAIWDLANRNFNKVFILQCVFPVAVHVHVVDRVMFNEVQVGAGGVHAGIGDLCVKEALNGLHRPGLVGASLQRSISTVCNRLGHF